MRVKWKPKHRLCLFSVWIRILLYFDAIIGLASSGLFHWRSLFPSFCEERDYIFRDTVKTFVNPQFPRTSTAKARGRARTAVGEARNSPTLPFAYPKPAPVVRHWQRPSFRHGYTGSHRFGFLVRMYHFLSKDSRLTYLWCRCKKISKKGFLFFVLNCA